MVFAFFFYHGMVDFSLNELVTARETNLFCDWKYIGKNILRTYLLFLNLLMQSK